MPAGERPEVFSGANLQAEINNLLGRTPSGPDFAQATTGYCQRCLDASLAKIRAVLVRQYPQLATEIGNDLEGLTKIRNKPSQPEIVDSNGRKLIRFQTGRLLPFNHILTRSGRPTRT